MHACMHACMCVCMYIIEQIHLTPYALIIILAGSYGTLENNLSNCQADPRNSNPCRRHLRSKFMRRYAQCGWVTKSYGPIYCRVYQHSRGSNIERRNPSPWCDHTHRNIVLDEVAGLHVPGHTTIMARSISLLLGYCCNRTHRFPW